jgi:hypothetical protein
MYGSFCKTFIFCAHFYTTLFRGDGLPFFHLQKTMAVPRSFGHGFCCSNSNLKFFLNLTGTFMKRSSSFADSDAGTRVQQNMEHLGSDRLLNIVRPE